jgi:hypothetical protein
MGRLDNEPFVEFLNSLKKAGVEIINEQELRERLAEAQRWRYAFDTLAMNGRSIGIRFADRGAGHNEAEIHRAFAAFQFPEKSEAIFTASLKASH